MAYDLEEQEQLATLRAFWKQYGTLLMTVVTVVLLAIAGWRAWGWYQARDAAEAAVVYEQLQVAVRERAPDRVKAVVGTLVERHARTEFAAMGALLAARSHLEAGDPKSARPLLQWVLDKGPDEGMRELARVRLAGLLLDEKAYDEGLKLLSGTAPARFVADWADRRGDLLLAQGKTEEARAEYKIALDKAEAGAPMRRVIQLKLDALGGSSS
jgi:predicted negative regulator of RcsB-dependent stress response